MKNGFFKMMILAALALVSCGGGRSEVAITPAPVPADFSGKTNPLGAEAAAEGAVVFNTNCAACHGPLGLGDGPVGAALDPSPKNLALIQAQVGDDYLFWRISTGKDGTSMVGWKGILTDEQIWQIVAFIRTLE